MADEARQTIEDSVREAFDVIADDDPTVADQTPVEASPEPAKEPETQQDIPPERIPLPSSWKRDPEWQADWEKLPLEAQKRIYQREYERDRETSRRIQELAEKSKFYGTVEQTLNPHLRDMYAAGIKPEQVIAEAIDLWHMSRRDKAGAAQYFLTQLGLNPQELLQQAQPRDPYVQTLEQKLSAIEQSLAYQQQAQAEQVRASIESEVATFGQIKDASGNLKYPHLESLAADMEPIVRGLRAQYPEAHPRQILDAAYERAYWANPQFREAEFRKQEQARLKEQADKAAAAKRTAVQVNGAPTGSIAQPAPSHIRDAVAAAYDNLG